MTNTIYLDHNATSPVHPAVIEAMRRCYAEGLGNAGSQHSGGRRARRELEDAREQIMDLLGARCHSADADQFVFTSGGTEANNLALVGMSGEIPGRMIVSSIEHPSILATSRWLQRRGWQVDQIQVDGSGRVEPDTLTGLLAGGPRPKLVSMMLGNNETGVIQPVRQIAEICRAHGILIHSDGVQMVGKMPVDFGQLGVDALSVAAHKLQGPCGIGGLLVRHGVSLQPILYGGAQQLGLRPGTEPVALAVGMLTALQIWQAESRERQQRLGQIRDRLQANLLAGQPTAEINGSEPRLPNTLNISFPGLNRQALLIALDLAGVACSTGSACASGSSEPSHVLQAMGLPGDRVESSIRLSLGAATTTAEADQAAERILSTVSRLRQQERPLNSPVVTRGERSKTV